jgi:hypothetical protein
LQFQGKGKNGGEGEIRTPGTLARTSHFECDAIDHSATSPHQRFDFSKKNQNRLWYPFSINFSDF